MKPLVPFKKLKLSLLVICLLMFTDLFAQNAVLSSGGDISTTSGSVSYSVGQVFYDFQSSASGTVAQGMQQPFEISEITVIKENENTDFSVVVYPNPSENFLNIKIDKNDVKNLNYFLYDYNGKMLMVQQIEKSETLIDMSALAPGCYFLKINHDKFNFKTFRIVKN